MNEENLSPTDFAPPETSSGTSRSSQGVRQQMPKSAQVTQAAQSEIEKLKGAAREQGSAAVEEIKTVAQSAAREAQEAGRDFVHEQKENLAQKVDKYAAAVRAACDRLRSEEGNVLADPAQMAAEQLGKMSSYLREKELGDLVDDLESFTRRRPEVVLGGFFVAGLAAARFFKASRRKPRRAGPAESIQDSDTFRISTPGSAPIPANRSESVSAAPAFPSAPSSSMQAAPTSSIR